MRLFQQAYMRLPASIDGTAGPVLSIVVLSAFSQLLYNSNGMYMLDCFGPSCAHSSRPVQDRVMKMKNNWDLSEFVCSIF